MIDLNRFDNNRDPPVEWRTMNPKIMKNRKEPNQIMRIIIYHSLSRVRISIKDLEVLDPESHSIPVHQIGPG